MDEGRPRRLDAFLPGSYFVVLEKEEETKTSGRVGRRSGRGFRLRRFSVGHVWLSAASRSGWPCTASTVPLTSGGGGGRRKDELDLNFEFQEAAVQQRQRAWFVRGWLTISCEL